MQLSGVTGGTGQSPAELAGTFDHNATLYHFGRPSYPEALIKDWAQECPLNSSSRVLDLAAGTGQLTRPLLRFTHARVVAIEKSEELTRFLKKEAPGAQVAVHRAEGLPFRRDSFDWVVAGEAAHWFDGERMWPDLAHVLKEDGLVAFAWSFKGRVAPWQRAVAQYLRPLSSKAPGGVAVGTGWREGLDADKFTPPESRRMRFSERYTIERFRALYGSYSYVSILPTETRNKTLDDISGIVRDALALSSDTEEFDFPIEVEYHLSRRLPR